MTELLELRPSDRVLDVGTGSGYHAAVLAPLAAHVWTIERHRALAERAAARARATRASRTSTLLVGDGSRGLPERGAVRRDQRRRRRAAGGARER